ncbi:hypothetical protein LXA43DRAFT_502710 [Ganoderma leucocontextum]|nr:hypothetical protein LXA43DRAFT_502710 [Ganoderma leucocontextum]
MATNNIPSLVRSVVSRSRLAEEARVRYIPHLPVLVLGRPRFWTPKGAHICTFSLRGRPTLLSILLGLNYVCPSAPLPLRPFSRFPSSSAGRPGRYGPRRAHQYSAASMYAAVSARKCAVCLDAPDTVRARLSLGPRNARSEIRPPTSNQCPPPLCQRYLGSSFCVSADLLWLGLKGGGPRSVTRVTCGVPLPSHLGLTKMESCLNATRMAGAGEEWRLQCPRAVWWSYRSSRFKKIEWICWRVFQLSRRLTVAVARGLTQHICLA